VFPNDDIECDRLDLQYEALKVLHDNKIFFAPLKDPRRILDIGTGTGIWPIEMGEFCSQLLCSHRIEMLTL
jgi:methylase of polypeptide subunit release factors